MSAGDGGAGSSALWWHGAVLRRGEQLFEQGMRAHHRRVDRLFLVLMLVQWVFAIGISLTVSPFAWEGSARSIHVHVYAAAVLGGAISALPVALALLAPGAAVTRYVIAGAQVLWSALLIHLTGGRIETHFHVFVSLAFLASYRDFRVLAPATITVATDHLLRGLYFPESVYAVANPEWWRFLEHAGWVVFEDVVLTIACVSGVRESRLLAMQRAELELLGDSERAKSRALNVALAELRTSQEALVRTEKLAAVGQLAASVGHELRNPLAAVRNAHAFIAKRVESLGIAEPRIGQFLGIADRELHICNRIIGELLDFARERPPARAPCPIRSLVEEAASVLPESTVRLVNGVPDELPIPDLDRDQFRQVFVNLLQNAMESIPASRPGEVRVEARHTCPGGIHITISDDGVGMPAEVASKIFEPLYTTKPKGTGLGLAIVSNIVKAHAGAIRVESEVDRGTRLVIELPVTV